MQKNRAFHSSVHGNERGRGAGSLEKRFRESRRDFRRSGGGGAWLGKGREHQSPLRRGSPDRFCDWQGRRSGEGGVYSPEEARLTFVSSAGAEEEKKGGEGRKRGGGGGGGGARGEGYQFAATERKGTRQGGRETDGADAASETERLQSRQRAAESQLVERSNLLLPTTGDASSRTESVVTRHQSQGVREGGNDDHLNVAATGDREGTIGRPLRYLCLTEFDSVSSPSKERGGTVSTKKEAAAGAVGGADHDEDADFNGDSEKAAYSAALQLVFPEIRQMRQEVIEGKEVRSLGMRSALLQSRALAAYRQSLDASRAKEKQAAMGKDDGGTVGGTTPRTKSRPVSHRNERSLAQLIDDMLAFIFSRQMATARRRAIATYVIAVQLQLQQRYLQRVRERQSREKEEELTRKRAERGRRSVTTRVGGIDAVVSEKGEDGEEEKEGTRGSNEAKEGGTSAMEGGTSLKSDENARSASARSAGNSNSVSLPPPSSSPSDLITAGDVSRALSLAKEEYERSAASAVPPGLSEETARRWGVEAEKQAFLLALRERSSQDENMIDTRLKKATTEEAFSSVVQSQQKQIAMLQQQLQLVQQRATAQLLMNESGREGGGSGGVEYEQGGLGFGLANLPVSLGLAYRLPDSNVNVSASHQRGRTNVQLSCLPDDSAPLLGPQGFVRGVGAGNLGISLNANL